MYVAGGMAAIGLTWEETKKRLPPGVDAACHNAHDSVTVSGAVEEVDEFVKTLQSENVFAKSVNSSGIPFHSRHMKAVGKPMKDYLSKVSVSFIFFRLQRINLIKLNVFLLFQFLKEPKLRSSRWISSSVPESKWDTDLAKYCSADYHVNNITSPVLFREALAKVPENSILIEVRTKIWCVFLI